MKTDTTQALFGEGHPASSEAARSGQDGEDRPIRRPLAVRMRPRCLSEIVGQQHVLGAECLLPRLIAADNLGSIMLFGPPGCGKTTLAEVIAAEVGSRFVRVNAVLSNVAEVRDILRLARARPEDRTILFIDEIHRFNKAQQDLLLPDVEQGNVRLIGATTHNPGFYIIPPLLSRSHLFQLQPLPVESIARLLREALADEERGLGNWRCTAEEVVFTALANFCDGDLRRGLNALETLVLSQPLGSRIGERAVKVFAEERQIRYDANEDEHYNTASAFIKSMRGGDPDAALYWLAKMLAGGEEPRFIARRLIIFASEDVGLADSRALSLATATWQACEFVGQPECEINLAHCTVFLATAPKSNRSYLGLLEAKAALRKGPVQEVPLWLRDSHTTFNQSLGHGVDYTYSHDAPENITGQEYMVEPKQFYHPGKMGAEAAIAERLERWKQIKHHAQKQIQVPMHDKGH